MADTFAGLRARMTPTDRVRATRHPARRRAAPESRDLQRPQTKDPGITASQPLEILAAIGMTGQSSFTVQRSPPDAVAEWEWPAAVPPQPLRDRASAAAPTVVRPILPSSWDRATDTAGSRSVLTSNAFLRLLAATRWIFTVPPRPVAPRSGGAPWRWPSPASAPGLRDSTSRPACRLDRRGHAWAGDHPSR